MTLLELVEKLGGLDPDLTIYAVEPWTPESVAVVALEPEDGGLPRVAKKIGAGYFLEVSIASEFLEGWQRTEGADSSIKESCERLIQYAVNDA